MNSFYARIFDNLKNLVKEKRSASIDNLIFEKFTPLKFAFGWQSYNPVHIPKFPELFTHKWQQMASFPELAPLFYIGQISKSTVDLLNVRNWFYKGRYSQDFTGWYMYHDWRSVYSYLTPIHHHDTIPEILLEQFGRTQTPMFYKDNFPKFSDGVLDDKDLRKFFNNKKGRL